MKELTEVLQRQKTRVSALQKERAELSAQLAMYHPAEQDKLRAEVATLRERIGELASLKVSLMKPHRCLSASASFSVRSRLAHFAYALS